MNVSWWLGIAAGLLVIGGHAALRIFTHRMALRRDTWRAFMTLELGGLAGRMAFVFLAAALVLGTVPVHETVFVGTVLALLVLSMGYEVRVIVRRMDQGALRP